MAPEKRPTLADAGSLAPPPPGYKTQMGGFVRTRRNRRQGKGKFKLYKQEWVDPYPWIDGTEPEKRVFAALMARRVYFIFQGQIPEFEVKGRWWFARPVNFKPDFVLPEYKLIIDPFSPFHHSLPKAAERDRSKIALYAAAGYAYYHPWAIGPGVWSWSQRHEIVNKKENPEYGDVKRSIATGQVIGTNDMLAMIPELTMGARYPLIDPRDVQAKRNPGYRMGQYVGAGANSVAAANHKRRRPPLLSFKTGNRRTVHSAGTKSERR
ncbi:MAG: hypothetical protein H0U53_10895 [Actinobacteria bacterium]|nr:hypothetical protein [Actinomycetota bacterium]